MGKFKSVGTSAMYVVAGLMDLLVALFFLFLFPFVSLLFVVLAAGHFSLATPQGKAQLARGKLKKEIRKAKRAKRDAARQVKLEKKTAKATVELAALKAEAQREKLAAKSPGGQLQPWPTSSPAGVQPEPAATPETPTAGAPVSTQAAELAGRGWRQAKVMAKAANEARKNA